MKWVLIGVGAIIVVVGLVTVWGALLPRAHVASSAITLKQPPDSVWAAIRDFGSANPIFRFLSYQVFGVHGTLDACLTALGARFGETVEPERLR